MARDRKTVCLCVCVSVCVCVCVCVCCICDLLRYMKTFLGSCTAHACVPEFQGSLVDPQVLVLLRVPMKRKNMTLDLCIYLSGFLPAEKKGFVKNGKKILCVVSGCVEVSNSTVWIG